MEINSNVADELVACRTLLRRAADRLERCVGQIRATAATLPIITAIQEIDEMARYRRKSCTLSAIAEVPFGRVPGQVESVREGRED
jgi:hypothetical protein